MHLWSNLHDYVLLIFAEDKKTRESKLFLSIFISKHVLMASQGIPFSAFQIEVLEKHEVQI